MSIKGIDTQIMVTRSSELAKESSNQLRRTDLMQDYLNVHAAELERHKQKMVLKTVATEQAKLHTDKDGSGGSTASRTMYKEKKQSDETPDELKILPDPNDKHLIDIII